LTSIGTVGQCQLEHQLSSELSLRKKRKKERREKKKEKYTSHVVSIFVFLMQMIQTRSNIEDEK